MRILLFIVLSGSALAAPGSLFDGKSFTGWNGDTEKVWRIEDGAIVGGSMEGNPRNEFLVTDATMKNFHLKLEYKLVGTEGFVNGGVQFHSQRIDNPPHEMRGYQADIGAKMSGCLYDESRRNKVLAAPEEKLVTALEKPGDWNTYEIRAEGNRIRLVLNGTQTVDYIEPDDAIPRSGQIGLQIHGDCKAVISFRNIMLERLPDDSPLEQSRVLNRFGDPAAAGKFPAPFTDGKFAVLEGEIFVFAGQTNLAREQKAGELEAALTLAHTGRKPLFRSMAWEADTVHEQWRYENFGPWEGQLKAAGATAVIAQFGQMEALDGEAGLAKFTAAYHRLLDRFASVTPRLVLISPMPFEKPSASHAPDLSLRNGDVKAYAEAVREIAKQRGAVFVDLFTPLFAGTDRLTENGIHLTDEGLRVAAKIIASQLGASDGDRRPTPELLKAIVAKNQLWADCWRPANWSFVYGDRISNPYAKSSGDAPSLHGLFESHKPLIAAQDLRIHAIARGETLVEIAVPQPPQSKGKVMTPEEQQAKFTIAEGYEVNLFADEKLGVSKPVQFSWDEKGRLYVACSPTYPQTLPGIVPTDFILVLEDTDGDGKADRSTRFAEGLTMVQGVEPSGDGLYLCDFDQILHLRDTDGDGRANEKKVIMSGFGIGDTHQLANSISHGPDGHLWFTQGLHAMSRVETPWGLSRLHQAGVWRFNPRTLRLDGFFGHATSGLNNWGVAFDDQFQMFHKSGDRPQGYYSLPGLIRLEKPDDYHPVGKLFDSSPKTTSLEFIGTKAMPDDIQGTALIAGYFGSVVELHKLIDDGSGFRSEQLPRLLKSEDPSFRPVDVGVGPDGAIYLADWFNPVIGHYQASYADPRRDRSHGRIWRITAKGRTPVKQPDLAKMSVAGLLGQLRSPERWTRYQSRRLLFYRATPEVLAAADAFLAKLGPDDDQLRIEVCGIFEAHRTPRPELLQSLLAAKDHRTRAYGARVIGNWSDSLPDPLGQLAKSTRDPHPRVRLESIVAASYIEKPEALSVTLQALQSPRDRFIDYALKHSVRSQAARGNYKRPNDPAQAEYLDKIVSAKPVADPPGKVIYDSLCMTCHQPEGAGLAGVYPPLTPNQWISGDPGTAIKILLHGLTGPITVSGSEYGKASPIPMPPMGLDDRQIADVLTYIRRNFGNKDAAVSSEEVKKIRDATVSRSTFWTAGELK